MALKFVHPLGNLTAIYRPLLRSGGSRLHGTMVQSADKLALLSTFQANLPRNLRVTPRNLVKFPLTLLAQSVLSQSAGWSSPRKIHAALRNIPEIAPHLQPFLCS